MTQSTIVAGSDVWIRDDQAFMHDQYQTLRDFYTQVSQLTEQRLSTFFTILAAAAGVLAVIVPMRTPWMVLAVPAGLLAVGVFTIGTTIYYAEYRTWLAGRLDLLTIKWTGNRPPAEKFLLLSYLWGEVNTGQHTDKVVAWTLKRVLNYSIRWREYTYFAKWFPHLALIALSNSGCVAVLAFAALSRSLLTPYAIALAVVLGAVTWAVQAIHCQTGIRAVESRLAEIYRSIGIRVEKADLDASKFRRPS